MNKILTALLALLAGCAVGPDYEAPTPGAPQAWAEAAGDTVSAAPADLSAWWTAFGDPTLDVLVARAIEANLDLAAAAARIREARAQAGHSRGALLPEIVGGADVTRNRQSENGLFPVVDKPEYRYHRAGFDAAWEIDVFGGIRRGVEAADAELEASIEDRRAVLVSLLGEVARAYVELRGGQRLEAVSRRSVAAARGTLDLTRTRLRAGLATQLDVARAEAQLANTEAVVPQAERTHRVALHRLTTLLGGEIPLKLDVEGPIPAPPARILVGLPSELVARRPDLRRAERKLAAATARVGVATAELYPKFSLTGAFGFESVDGSDFAAAASRAWSLGPAVRWPIFSGGRIRAEIEVQDARAEQALVAWRQSLLGAFEEVENALVGYLREWDQRRALEAAAAAGRTSVALAGDLYRKGLTGFLDVLEAERVLYEAERRLTESEAAVTLRVVALYKALGGGWESR